jgi:hypothetical protein
VYSLSGEHCGVITRTGGFIIKPRREELLGFCFLSSEDSLQQIGNWDREDYHDGESGSYWCWSSWRGYHFMLEREKLSL